MAHTRRGCAVVLALVAIAAGCGDDGGGGSDVETAAAAPENVECVNLPDCDVEVSQTEGLADGDVVSVRIAGWHPDAATGVSQCEDATDPDNDDQAPRPDGLPGPEVCNILGLTSPSQTETSDADGVLAFDYAVRAGTSMVDESERGECDADHDCQLIIFLTGASRLRSDAPRVSIPLTFA
jgi:hypothetical protein